MPYWTGKDHNTGESDCCNGSIAATSGAEFPLTEDQSKQLGAFESSGFFKKDFIGVCKILKVEPHPQVLHKPPPPPPLVEQLEAPQESPHPTGDVGSPHTEPKPEEKPKDDQLTDIKTDVKKVPIKGKKTTHTRAKTPTSTLIDNTHTINPPPNNPRVANQPGRNSRKTTLADDGASSSESTGSHQARPTSASKPERVATPSSARPNSGKMELTKAQQQPQPQPQPQQPAATETSCKDEVEEWMTVVVANIDVHSWVMDWAICKALSVVLPLTTSLTTLSLWKTELTPSAFLQLWHGIGLSQSITTVNIGWNALAPSYLAAITNNIGFVHALSLRCCGIDDELLKHLLPLLKKLDTHLISLALWGNSITDEGVVMMADCLLQNSLLGANKIGNDGADILSKVFTKFPLTAEETERRTKLRDELDLKRKNLIKRRKMGAPRKVVKKKPGMDDDTTEEGITKILAKLEPVEVSADGIWLIKGNTHLRHLNLSYNKIGERGAAMMSLPELRARVPPLAVDLSHNLFTPHQMKPSNPLPPSSSPEVAVEPNSISPLPESASQEIKPDTQQHKNEDNNTVDSQSHPSSEINGVNVPTSTAVAVTQVEHTHNEISVPTGYSTVTVGTPGTLEWRLFMQQDGKQISAWHDIGLVVDHVTGIFRYVVEIPKGTNAKLEISTAETGNPIKQDVKNGKLRFVANVHGFTGYPWNYGAFPQTWEDPSYRHPETNALGDKDPLDVVDISSTAGKTGDIRIVKVLGTLALIDEGETDWKVICIEINDPDANLMRDIEDIEKLRPGYLQKIHDWFQDYKIPDGKPPNQFAFEGRVLNREYALTVIEENHQFWKNKFGPRM